MENKKNAPLELEDEVLDAISGGVDIVATSGGTIHQIVIASTTSREEEQEKRSDMICFADESVLPEELRTRIDTV